jgi:protein-L-isoaspartate(D-aspartate) O-methyltransferase
MHVGAGAGYYTAILAELVGSAGAVVGFEIDTALASRAQTNLAAWPWARVEPRSGLTVPDEPVDLIYVNAGVQEFPRVWLDALSPRGRIIFPLVSRDLWGAVFMVQRGDGTTHPVRFISRASFVPCIGTMDAAAGARLSEAFRSDACERVNELRVGPDSGETAWFVVDGWSLGA